jgi:hypothetical protein
MPDVRRSHNGTHGYAAPVVLIAVLIIGYWLIAAWDMLPGMFNSLIGVIP